VVDVNLVRDKGTGKSKGFAFLAYEDQRSTILAVGERSLRPSFPLSFVASVFRFN
jgi:RNA recognition motif-containing protein